MRETDWDGGNKREWEESGAGGYHAANSGSQILLAYPTARDPFDVQETTFMYETVRPELERTGIVI